MHVGDSLIINGDRLLKRELSIRDSPTAEHEKKESSITASEVTLHIREKTKSTSVAEAGAELKIATMHCCTNVKLMLAQEIKDDDNDNKCNRNRQRRYSRTLDNKTPYSGKSTCDDSCSCSSNRQSECVDKTSMKSN
eukprot:scpid50417/ scgid10308/ 